MTSIGGLIVLSLVGLAVGAGLFGLMRWLFMRDGSTRPGLPKATMADVAQAAAVVTVLLVLIWMMESGSTLAATIFVILAVIAKACGLLVARKAKNQRNGGKSALSEGQFD